MRVKEFMWRKCIELCNDDSIGYTNDWPHNQWWRPPDLDCGALMSYILHMALLKINIDTGQQYFEPMGSSGFYNLDFLRKYCDQYDYNDVKNEPADILVSSGHTEMYLPDNRLGGARNDYDGREGDSSGREVAVSPFFNNGWLYIFRLKDKYNKEIEPEDVNVEVPTLKLGDTGNAVLTFQYIMRFKLGFDRQKLNGVYDAKMAYNVGVFQEEHGLVKDKVLGPITQRWMIVETGYEEP